MKFLIILFFLLSATPSFACEALQEKGYSLGKNGWIFRDKTDFKEEFEIRPEVLLKMDVLNQALKQQNIDLIISLLPTRGMMHANEVMGSDYDVQKAQNSYTHLLKIFNDNQIYAIGVTQFTPSQNFYYQRDHHWSPDGAEMMARLIADEINTQNVAKKNFKTEKLEIAPHKGSFDKKFEKYCDAKSDTETVQIYKTYAVHEDIFADQTSPDIVLIGTSNSDQKVSKSNFEGFLKQHISADVLNASISGGGFQSAMLQYFASDQYAQHKPKTIIWEFPIYQEFNDIEFYKQVIPAVYGQCETNAVLSQSVDIQGNKLIWNVPHDVFLDNTYLSIQIDGFKGGKFRMTLTDKDHRRQSLNFERSKFYQPDGQFFLDLSAYNNTQKIEALLPDGDHKTVSLDICTYSPE